MFGNGRFEIVRLDVQRGKDGKGETPENLVHELRKPTDVIFHSLVHRMQDFVHTCPDCRDCKSKQTHNHAQKGNLQISKNNIHGDGYQAVAKEHQEIRSGGNSWLFRSSLSL